MSEYLLHIVYRDELGSVDREIDGYGIYFCDGFAYFSNDNGDYKIPIESIEGINNI